MIKKLSSFFSRISRKGQPKRFSSNGFDGTIDDGIFTGFVPIYFNGKKHDLPFEVDMNETEDEFKRKVEANRRLLEEEVAKFRAEQDMKNKV